MNILPLYEFYRDKSEKSQAKLKRILEIACLDEDVHLAIKTPSIQNIWEYEQNLVENLNREEMGLEGNYYVHSYLGNRIIERDDVDAKALSEYYLLVNDNCLKDINNNFSGFSTHCSCLVQIYPDKQPAFIIPSSNPVQTVFIFCVSEKESTELKEDEHRNFDFVVYNLSLVVDLRMTKHREELISILPELNVLPEYAQNRLKQFPRKYKNMPERLECLIESYNDHWIDITPSSYSGASMSSIADTASEKMVELFNGKVEKYNKYLSKENEMTFGDKIKKFSAKAIEPEFIKDGTRKKKNQISYGIPRKLWVLCCVAEYFWRNVNRKELKIHPKNSHIELVFKLISSSYPAECLLPNAADGVETDLTPYTDAYADYHQIMHQYPEISHFLDVTFKSDFKLAATVIRPFWANNKNKGGNYHIKIDIREKRYCFISNGKDINFS